ncbi:MAG: hypothetical protein LKI67_07070 [Olsenella sp.]|nr:hypothetical protein [Olsenella sp.]MCI1811603.1 hypothetical protein [Olsenella sp.]MCI1879990.1 hypothetical protein [Olsenella sp.]
MAKKKQKRQTTAAGAKEGSTETPKGQPVVAGNEGGPKKVGGPSGELSADKARRASDAVLGDIIGMAKPIAIPDLPEDELELSVEEDRKRLLLQGLLLFLAVLALLFLTFWFGLVANATGNVWLLIALILSLTAAWFVSKRMGRFLGKFFMKTGVIDFGRTYAYIYEKPDPKEATVVPYKDIKFYKTARQGNSIRLLLWGGWVKHPSGYFYVGITRPFMAYTLDDLESQICETMARHRVKEKK